MKTAQPRSQRDPHRHPITTPSTSFKNSQVATSNAKPMGSSMPFMSMNNAGAGDASLMYQRTMGGMGMPHALHGYDGRRQHGHDERLQPNDGHGHGAFRYRWDGRQRGVWETGNRPRPWACTHHESRITWIPPPVCAVMSFLRSLPYLGLSYYVGDC